jgi:hypothetical protein
LFEEHNETFKYDFDTIIKYEKPSVIHTTENFLNIKDSKPEFIMTDVFNLISEKGIEIFK